jgi:hypothetical protein
MGAWPELATADERELEPRSALELEGQLGYADGDHTGGVTAAAFARARWRWITAGCGVELSSALFTSVASASAVGGVTIPLGILRFDLLGELGGRAYQGVGSNFLSDDPGAGAILPFAGVRAAWLARIHRSRQGNHVWLGVSGAYGRDLARTTREYSYRRQGTDWFTGEPYDERVQTRVDIGQTSYSLLASMGVTLPL